MAGAVMALWLAQTAAMAVLYIWEGGLLPLLLSSRFSFGNGPGQGGSRWY